MKRAQRLIAFTLLEANNVLLCHVNRQLHTILHREARDGLSDKEKAYLMKRHATLTQVQQDTTKLTTMMRRQYNDRSRV